MSTYTDMSDFDRALARFSDRVGIIAGLQMNRKISPEDAYQEIKRHYKEIKKLKKSMGM